MKSVKRNKLFSLNIDQMFFIDFVQSTSHITRLRISSDDQEKINVQGRIDWEDDFVLVKSMSEDGPYGRSQWSWNAYLEKTTIYWCIG